jgi:hypothetical protein
LVRYLLYVRTPVLSSMEKTQKGNGLQARNANVFYISWPSS